MPDFDPETETSYFAVYDGHGGRTINEVLSTIMYK